MNNKDIIDFPVNFFHYILINDILPFEAKYVSLKKSKNFSLIRNIIKLYFQLVTINTKINLDDFNDNYLPKIQNYIYPFKNEYFKLLFLSNESEIINTIKNDNDFKNSWIKGFDQNKNIIQSEIDNLIYLLEKKLDISNDLIEKNQLKITSPIHITSKIYKDDLIFMKKRLAEFSKYFKILEDILTKKYPNFLISTKKNTINELDKITNLEYLYFTITHEFLNYLAHYSMGIAYFNSPNNYISNLNKATSHLKRAIMDLLDVMILEFECATKDYLKIRVFKLASLGNRTKIEDLISKLENVFEQCVKPKLYD